jgi:hypothetical protein
MSIKEEDCARFSKREEYAPDDDGIGIIHVECRRKWLFSLKCSAYFVRVKLPSEEYCTSNPIKQNEVWRREMFLNPNIPSGAIGKARDRVDEACRAKHSKDWVEFVNNQQDVRSCVKG